MRSSRFVVAVGLMTVLCACGSAGSQGVTPHQQRNTDPLALTGKLHALMADECYTGDAATMYPRCGKFFTELVGTANAVTDAVPNSPRSVSVGSQRLNKGIAEYNQRSCAPIDQQPQPSLTAGCAQALQDTRAGLRVVSETLSASR